MRGPCRVGLPGRCVLCGAGARPRKCGLQQVGCLLPLPAAHPHPGCAGPGPPAHLKRRPSRTALLRNCCTQRGRSSCACGGRPCAESGPSRSSGIAPSSGARSESRLRAAWAPAAAAGCAGGSSAAASPWSAAAAARLACASSAATRCASSAAARRPRRQSAEPTAAHSAPMIDQVMVSTSILPCGEGEGRRRASAVCELGRRRRRRGTAGKPTLACRQRPRTWCWLGQTRERPLGNWKAAGLAVGCERVEPSALRLSAGVLAVRVRSVVCSVIHQRQYSGAAGCSTREVRSREPRYPIGPCNAGFDDQRRFAGRELAACIKRSCWPPTAAAGCCHAVTKQLRPLSSAPVGLREAQPSDGLISGVQERDTGYAEQEVQGVVQD